MQTILFFTPYTPWLPHTLPEVAMGHALKQRGHTVRFLTCSGLPNCGMAPKPMADREFLCANCRNYTQEMLPKLRHRAEYFQTAITANEAAHTEEWAASLRVEELASACYAGLPVGEWAMSDMISRWHTRQLRMERPEVEDSYRTLLIGAAQAALAVPRLYDKHAPDCVVTLNGTFLLQRVAVEVARARGIRVVVHERGWRENTIMLFTSGRAGSIAEYRERWDSWKDVPLSQSELEGVARILGQRRIGANMGWAAFSPIQQTAQSRAEICAELGLPDRPLALFCTSSDCEGSIQERSRALEQREWIERTAHWFGAHPEYVLAIRVHPNEQGHAKVDDRILQWYAGLQDRLPRNVRLIMPDEEISTYGLMDVASAGLSYGSTAGLEMACLGLPVVHAGMGYYKDCGFTHEIRDASDIAPIMARVMEQGRDERAQRRAYRFMQRLFMDVCLPFDKVRVSANHFQADLTYQSVAELAPGRDPQLDRIAEFLLGNAPLFAPPTPLELSRTTRDEDAFFAALNTTCDNMPTTPTLLRSAA